MVLFVVGCHSLLALPSLILGRGGWLLLLPFSQAGFPLRFYWTFERFDTANLPTHSGPIASFAVACRRATHFAFAPFPAATLYQHFTLDLFGLRTTWPTL